jgi:hypothetical protein
MAIEPTAEEIHLAFPVRREAIKPASKFRSTWLTSSLRAINTRERLDEYMRYLPAQHHEAVMSSVAGTWLPVEVAVAHYEACDLLNFPSRELFTIGHEVHEITQGTVFGTMVKVARGVGVTPWTALSQCQRLWDRVWIGGGLAVFKLGPKEARLEFVGWPCAGSTYIRHAMRGGVCGMLEMFCTRVHMTDMPRLCTATTLGYRIAWA